MYKKILVSMLMVVVLIVAAGCQSIGTLDLNKVMMSNLDIQSLEGKQSISVDFKLDESAAVSKEQQKQLGLLKVLNQTSLRLTDIKQQDQKNISMKGELILSKGKIPFHIHMDDQTMTIQVEGAAKPFVFKSDMDASAATYLDNPAVSQYQSIVKSLGENNTEWVKKLASFAVSKLPNPQNISVESAQVTIHNESLQLQKVALELNVKEFMPLARQFIKNITADEEGLKQFIGDIIDLLGQQPDAPAYFKENKEMLVMMAFGMIQNYLTEMSESIDKADRSNQPFTDDSYLKMNIYADADHNVRKSDMELNLAPLSEEQHIVTAITIKSDSEVWNVNKSVQAQTVDVSGGVIEVGPGIKSYEFLDFFDSNSTIYELLKNDIRITAKNITLFPDSQTPQKAGYAKPFIQDDVTLVPVRFVSERLEADIEWKEETSQVTITDAYSGTTIVLTIGQKEAEVNGQMKQLEVPAQLIEGSSYVPIRFIAESLGATVSYDEATGMAAITRD